MILKIREKKRYLALDMQSSSFMYWCVVAGESKEITISFSPDHASELYADEVSVEINSGVSRTCCYDFDF